MCSARVPVGPLWAPIPRVGGRHRAVVAPLRDLALLFFPPRGPSLLAREAVAGFGPLR